MCQAEYEGCFRTLQHKRAYPSHPLPLPIIMWRGRKAVGQGLSLHVTISYIWWELLGARPAAQIQKSCLAIAIYLVPV